MMWGSDSGRYPVGVLLVALLVTGASAAWFYLEFMMPAPGPSEGAVLATDSAETAPQPEWGQPAPAPVVPVIEPADFEGAWTDGHGAFYAIKQSDDLVRIYDQDYELIGSGRIEGRRLQADFPDHQRVAVFEMTEDGSSLSAEITNLGTSDKATIDLYRDVEEEAGPRRP